MVNVLVTPLVNHLFKWWVSLVFSHLVIHLIDQSFFQFMSDSVKSFGYLVTNSVR